MGKKTNKEVKLTTDFDIITVGGGLGGGLRSRVFAPVVDVAASLLWLARPARDTTVHVEEGR